ncbi:hypothetical protein SDC9_114001 [bioreactor metagenome]|uniref:Uncharacterized protein n=1 Tax=bioreactor metagenome TaxID=1076179 RepID=A0A645BP80_9ZZZZ
MRDLLPVEAECCQRIQPGYHQLHMRLTQQVKAHLEGTTVQKIIFGNLAGFSLVLPPKRVLDLPRRQQV